MVPERTALTKPFGDVRTYNSGKPYELKIRIPGDRDHENFITRTVETTSPNNMKTKPKTPPPLAGVEDPLADKFSVDREKTCPLLLRVFCNVGRHFSLMEFLNGNTPSGELQIYTWMDATLKELTGLIREVHPDARKRGTYFEFNIVFPERGSRQYRNRAIGTTKNGERGQEDNLTLEAVEFQIGDFLSVAIHPPDRFA
ncbi:histone deacetylase complex subunit SAP18-like [Paramacrobiotus metropolitanus]|uniref:histone deacetylase complex subunit SAP18-like n=1 Tax=Paramacrobiotus metropolitanus TaxID=2943436 RepID=UPI0024456CC3|nr:histone deacetylase complex subunit SAP18-like [Paramacrobiotus metropolitanus]XP_055335180.1 histone deacetylase complex subunit SAP18-like [Paramacrobiotus metropolitanus]XP_055335181.1 histone deacetylase complex subunit SAP18-like [Paramacrobiotus metropolitanus]